MHYMDNMMSIRQRDVKLVEARAIGPSQALSALIHEVFLLNGRLLSVGDKLAAQHGLTSARWQVLGAIAFAPTPQPVVRLAHGLGLRRQGVQRIVNELAEEGIVTFLDNPHHRRAKLVGLTKKGRDVHDAASRLQAPWIDSLAESADVRALLAAVEVIATVRKRLDQQDREWTRKRDAQCPMEESDEGC